MFPSREHFRNRAGIAPGQDNARVKRLHQSVKRGGNGVFVLLKSTCPQRLKRRPNHRSVQWHTYNRRHRWCNFWWLSDCWRNRTLCPGNGSGNRAGSGRSAHGRRKHPANWHYLILRCGGSSPVRSAFSWFDVSRFLEAWKIPDDCLSYPAVLNGASFDQLIARKFERIV
jgi:hypothetical protein